MRTRHARAAVLAGLVTLLAATTPGTAAAPARAKRGTLTGDTTIRWRGNAGIRLATNGGGSLPQQAMTLHLSRGTYAFVVMLDDPQPARCRDGATVVHCHGFSLLKVPGSQPFAMAKNPDEGHLDFSAIPPVIVGRHLDVYLFTDGEATLRLRPRGYRGRSSYVAAGRFRGLARRLPAACADVCGQTAASEVAAGGAAFDFDNRPGHLLALGFNYTPGDVDHLPSNHPNAQRTCFYPTPWQPDASPEPRDHPFGCDPLPREVDRDAPQVLMDTVTSVDVRAGSATTWWVSDLRGPVYAGFYAARAWVERAYVHGHAVWFNYGIT